MAVGGRRQRRIPRTSENTGWIAKRPDFDDRLAEADPTMKNCGLTHFKHHTMVDDNTGKRSIHRGAGHILAEQNDFSKEKFKRFRYGVLDLGEEALGWYFDITRPQLYEYCRYCHQPWCDA